MQRPFAPRTQAPTCVYVYGGNVTRNGRIRCSTKNKARSQWLCVLISISYSGVGALFLNKSLCRIITGKSGGTGSGSRYGYCYCRPVTIKCRRL